MTDYDIGRNDGMIIGFVSKGILIKKKGNHEEGLQDIEAGEYEVIGSIKVLPCIKGEG